MVLKIYFIYIMASSACNKLYVLRGQHEGCHSRFPLCR